MLKMVLGFALSLFFREEYGVWGQGKVSEQCHKLKNFKTARNVFAVEFEFYVLMSFF